LCITIIITRNLTSVRTLILNIVIYFILNIELNITRTY